MAELIYSGLTKQFDGSAQPALDGIDARIESGEFVALLGPSGCGKTTLLRLTAGFEEPTGGEIRMGDTQVAGPGCFVPPEDRGVGIVFQSYALWPHMTVAGNVSYPLEVRGLARAERARRVEEALSLTGLTEFAHRAPAQLSGGQRQRVALARCLVAEPRAVLLDEPLANLDLALRASMQENFTAFHRRTGATMLYVTHDQGEALALATRVAVMERGRIRQFAAPEVLYSEPADCFVAGFVGDGAVVSASAAGPLGRNGLEVETMGLRVAARSNEALPTHLCIRPEDVSLTDEGGLRARVRGCTYQGGRFRVVLDTGGEDLVAFSRLRLEVGAQVGLRIDRPWAFREPGLSALPARATAHV
ncbi:ABC transporter ATP-binding protein [Marinibacterium profundimaris]|uniref:Spermidine/putrescine ABC transporter ATP-binding protein n=1 Tax=Marinibacterium profundimaris TaxID=1679460 RepID=A0A225NDI1_9RHOB|nr:ABC transporter ATP-binding protein [Marinibacterium profundimaris]OWU69976.1 spermidine/putrescine ABC transporter ATP-binding protein [Marinibacterium profundimaris]